MQYLILIYRNLTALASNFTRSNMAKLPDSIWTQIRIRYETTFDSIRSIARDYGIDEKTIRTRIKDENWVQVVRDTSAALRNTIEILADIREFCSMAAALNKTIMVKLATCTDLETQYKGMAAMKATVKDLVDMARNPQELPMFSDGDPDDEANQPLEITFVKKVS